MEVNEQEQVQQTGGRPSRVVWVVLAVVLAAALAALGAAFAVWYFNGQHAPVAAPSENTSFTAVNDSGVSANTNTYTNTAAESNAKSTTGRFSQKLDGALEQTDEHGVVYGTTPAGINYAVRGRGEAAAQADKVTLAACGDQIVSANALGIAARNFAETGNGDGYDFSFWYQETTPFVSKYDLRFINPETVTCNTAERAPTGWPAFISPDSAVDNLAAQGYNVFNFASNHIYDYGVDAIIRTHEQEFSKYPGITVVGSYLSEESAETVHMIERNGINFAFLAYTFADNTYFQDYTAMPNYYLNRPFDYDTINADVARAKQVADVVIVGMHWGTEYVSEPNSQQYEWAEYLADMGVDLVLGTHAHIMQPVQYITGPASGHVVPVVFGLSDFVSGWTITDTILSGIFTCDFVPQADGTVAVKNPAWNPTIEWSDGSTSPYVRLLANMSADEINANTRTPDVSDDFAYLYDMIHNLITEIPIAW
ncbi:MAG: CapA family protein [Coriobacteriia bacterium]|nr:CapA family protein [Coriobacteriia bacterium]